MQAAKDSKTRKEIIEGDGKCLLVEASAGTGKTTLLVNRIFHLVTEKKAKLSRIAAITFTEKAAGELKIRLYQEISSRLSTSSNEEEKELLEEALEDLESCDVSTIHSFAANLLRARPIESGVDPSFVVADENKMLFIKQEAADDWLKERFTAPNTTFGLYDAFNINPDKMKMLADLLYEHRDLTQGVQKLKSDNLLTDQAIEELLKEAENLCLNAAAQLRKVLAEFTPSESDTSLKAIRAFIALVDSFVQWGTKYDIIKLALKVAEKESSERGKTNWSEAPQCFEEQLRIRRELKSEINRILDKIENHAQSSLVSNIEDYIAKVEDTKKKEGLLDFGDLLIKSRDLLKNNKEVRGALQKKYSHIFVDEFQDTDPLQVEIAFFLSEEYPEAGEWSQVRLKPGKLFIVGDPKQSIYRFRRADIESYKAAKQIIREAGSVKIIEQNFRSANEVLKWVNEAIGPAMSKPHGLAYQAEYAPISSDIEATDSTYLKIFTYTGESGENLETLREREAALLTNEISKLIESGMKIREAGKKRPVRFSDITILFRYLTSIEIHERAFRAAEIPFRTEGGRTFFSRQEVTDIANALRAIENPHDQVSLVGALRSPLFSVSDEELASYKVEGGTFDYTCWTSAEMEAQNKLPSIKAAFKTLDKLHKNRNAKSISQITECLISQTRAREIYALEGNEQAIANISKVVDLAEDLGGSEPINLRAFADWLSRMQKEGLRVGESPLEEAGGDFVKIMTVHQAKGLEFPVVFIAGMGKASRPGGAQLLARYSQGEIGFKVGNFSTQNFDNLLAWEKESESAESCRLFYVACTRARDLLVINDFSTSRRASWLSEVVGKAEERTGKEFEEQVDLPLVAQETPTPREETAKAGISESFILAEEQKFKEALDESRSRRKREEPCEDSSKTKSEVSRDTPPLWPNITIGKEVGNALHKVMEILPFDATPTEVRKIIGWAAGQFGVTDKVEQLEPMVENIIGSEIYKRALAAHFVCREMPLACSSEEPHITRKIDLLFVEDDMAVIVDYKSDNVAPEGVEDRAYTYIEQGKAYRKGIEEATGMKVKDVIFYFAAPGIPFYLPV